MQKITVKLRPRTIAALRKMPHKGGGWQQKIGKLYSKVNKGYISLTEEELASLTRATTAHGNGGYQSILNDIKCDIQRGAIAFVLGWK